MRYDDLKSEIVSILHSADYNFTLKFYDKDGNTTLEPTNVDWIYITNYNILIELPSETNPDVILWKEDTEDKINLEKIIKRMRKQTILYGSKIQVKLFNNLDRRKLHNIIKNAMDNVKEKTQQAMESKMTNNISKKLYEAVNVIRSAKKSSDVYMSKDVLSKNIISIMENAIKVITSIDSLNNNRVKNLLKSVFLESSFNSIDNIANLFEQKCPNEYKLVQENMDNIVNATKFASSRYIDNKDCDTNKHCMKIFENVVVYPTKEKLERENCIKAYNHLLSLTENVTRGIDVLRVIKNNRLCETYKISKDELLDMWISKNVGEKIEPKTLIVFETSNGKKYTYGTDVLPSVDILAEHFNKGGDSNDSITSQIIEETVKYNSLKDLVENYYYNTGIKKYAKSLVKLCKESLDKISKNDFREVVMESEEEVIDYSKELSNIETATGFRHPGFKYIAIEEAKQNKIKNEGKLLETLSDERTLRENFSKFMTFKKSKDLASIITKTKIGVVKQLDESKDVIKQLVNNIYSADENVKKTLNECLTAMVLYPNLANKNKTKFVNTLKKYII